MSVCVTDIHPRAKKSDMINVELLKYGWADRGLEKRLQSQRLKAIGFPKPMAASALRILIYHSGKLLLFFSKKREQSRKFSLKHSVLTMWLKGGNSRKHKHYMALVCYFPLLKKKTLLF